MSKLSQKVRVFRTKHIEETGMFWPNRNELEFILYLDTGGKFLTKIEPVSSSIFLEGEALLKEVCRGDLEPGNWRDKVRELCSEVGDHLCQYSTAYTLPREWDPRRVRIHRPRE